MSGVIESGLHRDVSEFAVSEIVEKAVAVPHSGDEQIRFSIVVNISKGCGYTDLPAHSHAGLLSNVFELATAEVSPKLVTTHLIHKIDVIEPITVHIRHRDAVAVVVVVGLILCSGIFRNGWL